MDKTIYMEKHFIEAWPLVGSLAEEYEGTLAET